MMNPFTRRLAACVGWVICCWAAGPVQPAFAALMEQAPITGNSGAVAMGSALVTPLLAESFSFSGQARQLSWWGTRAGGFEIKIYAGDGSGSALHMVSSFSSTAVSGFTLDVDVTGEGDPDPFVQVFRFDIELSGLNLAAGNYTVSIEETVSVVDPAEPRLWYWVQGSGGDGQSVSGLGDPGAEVNRFDLSLQVTGERTETPVPEPDSLALASLALAGLAAGRRRGRDSR